MSVPIYSRRGVEDREDRRLSRTEVELERRRPSMGEGEGEHTSEVDENKKTDGLRILRANRGGLSP